MNDNETQPQADTAKARSAAMPLLDAFASACWHIASIGAIIIGVMAALSGDSTSFLLGIIASVVCSAKASDKL